MKEKMSVLQFYYDYRLKIIEMVTGLIQKIDALNPVNLDTYATLKDVAAKIKKL